MGKTIDCHHIINSSSSGGICGYGASIDKGNCDISNCFSYINSLTGQNSGSILGSDSKNVKLHNVFSNQEQYFVDGTNISGTYDNIYNVSKFYNT